MALLEGFGFTGFRSVRGPLQLVGPLSKVNLVAGQNNAGKSNVLRVADQYVGHGTGTPSGLDVPRQGNAEPFRIAIARRLTSDAVRDAIYPVEPGRAKDVIRTIDNVFQTEGFRLTGDDLIWFQFKASDRRKHWVLDSDWLKNVATHYGRSLHSTSMLLAQEAGTTESSNLDRIVQLFSPLGHLPPVKSIEAFRQITASDEDNPESAEYYNGRGLIRGLQRLQSPQLDSQSDKHRFQAVNEFVQAVLDDPTARLEVPHDAESILVHRGDLVLPLEYLGTGVHQVVILAVAATLLQDTLVCMEEPEVHLHPLLQRKLVRYLNDKTSNQYLIATHSAHMLDHERATVFHVQHSDDGTVIERAGTPTQVAALCADLGYRPSDLLQSNAIIWVEGPSDRIYLRRWIELSDDTLVEGIHYSIMFYGGRLLNHLTAQDPLIEEFISLRALNRNIAILIDSDKHSAHAHIGETKKRVRDEFDADDYPGFAWITDCRTIENYLPLALLTKALSEVHPHLALTYDGTKWADPLEVRDTTKRKRKEDPRVDKVRLSHAAAAHWTVDDLNHLDLKKQVQRVVRFIHTANGTNGD